MKSDIPTISQAELQIIQVAREIIGRIMNEFNRGESVELHPIFVESSLAVTGIWALQFHIDRAMQGLDLESLRTEEGTLEKLRRLTESWKQQIREMDYGLDRTQLMQVVDRIDQMFPALDHA